MFFDISLPTPPAKTPTHPIMFYFSALKNIVFYRIQSFGFIKLYILEGAIPTPPKYVYIV